MTGVAVLVLLAACGNNKKTDADPFASITRSEERRVGKSV